MITTDVVAHDIILPPFIQSNVPLCDKNWFGTGGPARYFSAPTTQEELQQALVFAGQNNLTIFVLGSGANVLISDEGFDGLVIRPQLQNVSIKELNEQEVVVTAGAGLTMGDLILFCLANEILGLEEFSGIPGTVGGSVFINLHYYEFLLSHFLVRGQVIHKQHGTLHQVDNAWFKFGYNTSALQNSNYYLVDATFKLRKALDKNEIAYASGRRVEIIRHRAKRYPTAMTCGSFFRNFYETEVGLESDGKKIIYVAYYLDKIGVKGALSYGGAQVSYQHANMIVNHGKATSADIVQLARLMQEKVHDAFGIMPQPECLLVGFKNYPLL